VAERSSKALRGSTADYRTHDPYGSPDGGAIDELSLVVQAVESVQDWQKSWSEKCEKRYRAYRGIAEARQDKVATWRSSLTTPYILQVVEGMLSTILDPKPKWEVDPRPFPGEPLEEILARRQSGRIAGAALQYAMDADNFALKQRPFVQQDLICGVTVAKGVWAYEAKDMKRLVPVEIEVTDDYGNLHDSYTSTEEEDRLTVVRDGPSMVVRDVRDFFWPESAKSVDDAAWIIDRTWMTYDELEQKERAGFYKHCSELKEARNEQVLTDYTDREQMLWSRQRNKDLIEVLEYWTDDRVITVGGRRVVLDSRPNPFRIKRKPFVVCSGLPDGFQFVGISVVESLAQLQEYLWTLQNQRIDALRLLTNVISIIRSDVDDPDSFEFFPGAQWIVEDPSQVSQLQFDPTAAQITLEAESLIKGDLQNMMGGLPFAGGAESVVQGAGGSTATGMSIVTSIAQKMIASRKQNYMWGFSQMGELFLGMMGQMLREERTISQIGPSGQQLLQIHPLDLQGDFNVNVNVMDESAIREQKRSEAMALMNLCAGLVQIMPNFNLQPVMEKVLESYGITNTEEFFTPQPPAAAPGAPPGGTPPGAAGIQEGMNGGAPMPIGSQGQTNPALAAQMGGGAGQAGLSMSPDMFAQQQVQAAQQMGMGAQG
jgi:hypothetical protein